MATDPLFLLRSRRAEIARQIELLRGEDADLAAAEAVLARYTGDARPKAPLPGPGGQRPSSQREFVVEVLLVSDPPWLQANEILGEIKRRWNHRISPESLRPLLSAMKREGIIARRGRLVALSSRAGARGV